MENTPLSSLKVSDQTFKKLQEAVSNSEMSVADIRRWALTLGLDALKRMNYDVEGFLSAQVEALTPPPLQSLPDSLKHRNKKKA